MRNVNCKLLQFLTAILMLVIFSCQSNMPKKELEEWAIYKYHLEGEDQLKKEKEKSMYSAIPLFLDYQNGWFILHATDTVRAKFYEDNKGEILTEIEIRDSSLDELKGKHSKKVDTLKNTETTLELRIIIKSDQLYLLGRRQILRVSDIGVDK